MRASGTPLPGPQASDTGSRALSAEPGTPRRVRIFRFTYLIAICALFVALPVHAQEVTLDFSPGTGLNERALQLIALITVLSLAPSILVMVTSFTRIVVVLSLLRTAIGLQTAPPNSVMVSLALFLTGFIMYPVFQQAYDEAITPLVNEEIEINEAFNRGIVPFRTFMLAHVREKDLELFIDMSQAEQPENPDDVALQVLVPAFMISELRRAFEIGFLLFVPFIVIDLVVASILMSMGMMMLPPVIISLPFKLIFFVLVDGWSLVAGSLVRSYTG
ncbi:flagellar type III secretion system pore protein FliP [Tepidamorphus sp. 3E244]|uniref:flagellar type III secretion system pore protein FliP n=1 Tax=Tepidamorphus sp. 3E244 TaxID=3385498 RepID=UPI0038FC2C02